MKKLFLIGFGVAVLAGCQKESDFMQPASPEVSTKSTAQASNFNCALPDIHATNYFVACSTALGDMSYNPTTGSLENYLICNDPAVAIADCCPPVTYYLDPSKSNGYSSGYASFELWCPTCTGTNYLANGVFDANEQLSFITRVKDYANSLYIPCSGGQMVPVAYNFHSDLIPNGTPNALAIVEVTFAPMYCFTPFP